LLPLRGQRRPGPADLGDKIKTGLAKPNAVIQGLSRDLGALVSDGQKQVEELARKVEGLDLSNAIPDAKLFGVLPLRDLLGTLAKGQLPTVNLIQLPDHWEHVWDWNTPLKSTDLWIVKFDAGEVTQQHLVLNNRAGRPAHDPAPGSSPDSGRGVGTCTTLHHRDAGRHATYRVVRRWQRKRRGGTHWPRHDPRSDIDAGSDHLPIRSANGERCRSGSRGRGTYYQEGTFLRFYTHRHEFVEQPIAFDPQGPPSAEQITVAFDHPVDIKGRRVDYVVELAGRHRKYLRPFAGTRSADKSASAPFPTPGDPLRCRYQMPRISPPRSVDVRVYLRRPWHGSGPEALGVIVAPSILNTVRQPGPTQPNVVADDGGVFNFARPPEGNGTLTPGIPCDSCARTRPRVAMGLRPGLGRGGAAAADYRPLPGPPSARGVRIPRGI
jgi:hypothetical protein